MHAVEQGYHRIARTLAARGRYREHNTHRQSRVYHCFTCPKIPEITVVGHPGSYGFGCVDDRATAYGKYPSHIVVAGQCYAFAHFRIGGIRLYAAEQDVFHTGLVKRV